MFEPKPRKENSAVIDLTTLAEHQILIEYRKGRSAEKIQAAHAAGHLSPDKTRLWLRPATPEVGHQFLSSVGLTTADVIMLDSYPLPKAPRTPVRPTPQARRDHPWPDAHHQPLPLGHRGPSIARDRHSRRLCHVRPAAAGATSCGTEASRSATRAPTSRQIQNWFRTAGLDKQEILLIDEGAYKLRGWSSFKDWFLPVLEAKIDFTQPIYAAKKTTTAPSISSEAARRSRRHPTSRRMSPN